MLYFWWRTIFFIFQKKKSNGNRPKILSPEYHNKMAFFTPMTVTIASFSRSITRSPWILFTARVIFTCSTIKFSQHIKLHMGQESDGVGLYNLPWQLLPGDSRLFYAHLDKSGWCLEMLWWTSRKTATLNCSTSITASLDTILTCLDVHKSLSSPGKSCLGSIQTHSVWLLPHK